MMAEWGLPRYRADQVVRWVYQRGVAQPHDMSNIASRDKALLAGRIRFETSRVIAHQQASDGTEKLLLQWPSSREPGSRLAVLDPHGEEQASSLRTECVMIPSPKSHAANRAATPSPREWGRTTACISSQVGCPVGCRFCASGLDGLLANLTRGQIVEQVWRLSALPGVGRISHVVFMGMGEPLANFEAVTQAITTLTAPWGLGISARRITISTVGLPAQIRRLADLALPITLALSLHAPNDELRRRLIPWAQYVTIDQLLQACGYYFDRTGREVTLEYTLLGGVNDQPSHASELAKLAGRLRSNVNLIRYNEVDRLAFARPSDEAVRRFQAVLRQASVNTHIRASRGRDIAAACGQLRRVSQRVSSQPTIHTTTAGSSECVVPTPYESSKG